MLKASTETSSHWFPGKKLEGSAAAPLSTRAAEIAKGREELLGLLHDVPESDYELSLTDLVVEKVDGIGAVAADQTRAKERSRRRHSTSSSSSCGGEREGVFLNVYVPALLTRSFTGSRASRGAGPRVETDCSKRDGDAMASGCWPALWERRRERSRRQALERRR